MRERPLLFSAPMVRAILDGRKTVTRRIVKPMRGEQSGWLTPAGINGSPRLEIATTNPEGRFGARMEHPGGGPLGWIASPYGQPGDRLWVRETFAWPKDGPQDRGFVAYQATHGDQAQRCWKPSIHMPRWASRITLEVTGVRVERLHAGEGEDYRRSCYLAEGINRIHHGDGAYYYSAFRNEPHPKNWSDPFDAWRELWQSTGGDWDANPWVWAVEFKRLTQERAHA